MFSVQNKTFSMHVSNIRRLVSNSLKLKHYTNHSKQHWIILKLPKIKWKTNKQTNKTVAKNSLRDSTRNQTRVLYTFSQLLCPTKTQHHWIYRLLNFQKENSKKKRENCKLSNGLNNWGIEREYLWRIWLINSLVHKKTSGTEKLTKSLNCSLTFSVLGFFKMFFSD